MNNKQYQKTRDTPHANECYGKPSRQRVMGNAGTKGLLLYLGSDWDRPLRTWHLNRDLQKEGQT